MAELPSYFRDFLHEINLTAAQVKELKEAHTLLRSRLEQDEALSKIFVATFLHGSYRRSTAVRPAGEQRSDVDVIVVTNIDRETHTPAEVFDLFVPFMERCYKGKYRLQGRSIGIEMSQVDLDVVPTSAPSEVDGEAVKSASVRSYDTLEEAPDWRLNRYWVPTEMRDRLESQSMLYKAATEAEWKAEPLWIPDREAKCWQTTNPLAQLQLTRDKNKATNGCYVRVVKALKWWRRTMQPEPERPKSYPFERILRECCPDGITSVAEGVTKTLEDLVSRFYLDVLLGRTPTLTDPDVPQNVLHRITPEDFAAFYAVASEAATLARRALDEKEPAESARLWRELFGAKFPDPDDKEKNDKGGGTTGGFSERRELTDLPRTRFG
jgi:hypothetical protein